MTRFSLRATLALFGLLALTACGFSFGVRGALAQQAPVAADVGLTEVGQTTVLSSQDPRTIVVRIINIALSLIGIILISIVIYAGFLWMTSGGDTQKVEKAKLYLRNAIIGLLIILSSWAITRFVLSSLLGATGGGSGGRGQVAAPGGGSSGGSFGTAGVSGGFYLEGIEPSGTLALRNVQVRFVFSQEVTAAQVAERVHVNKATGEAVAGRLTVEGGLVTFTPAQACPAPAASRFCFDASTDFIAKVDSSLRSTTGQALACGGLGAVCEGRFRTGDRVDVAGPVATLLQPFAGQSIPQNESVELIGSASDDSGISFLQFSADGRLVGRTTPTVSTTPTSFDGSVVWNTTGAALGAHQLQVTAFDADSNQTSSTPVAVMVRAETCFNDRQDGDETGPDCGGSCGACSGGSCRVSSDCSSGVCGSGGSCVERPVITAISPNNGRIGTMVTISGDNFGTAGEVLFAGNVRARLPARCTETGSGWMNNAVVVEVPVGARSGAVLLKNAISGLSDSSDDETGPKVNYTVNEATYPGICALNPDEGSIGTPTRLLGAGFGSSSDRVQVGETMVSAFRGWTDGEISLNIPTISPGTASVRVRVGTAQSNPVPFAVTAARTTEGPVIEGIDPVSGPVGQYITIRGQRFGDLAGLVQVVGPDGSQGPADTDFPAACDAATRYWSDNAVTFKIPASLRATGLGGTTPVAPGTYQIYLQRRDGSTPSNRFGLTVVTGTPGPGLCALTPDTGPNGTEVKFSGERFGSEQGTVRFQAGGATVDAVSITEWTDQMVRAIVPAGARTGAVTILARSQSSNALPYTVRNCAEDAGICSTTERCCEGSGVCAARSGGVCPAVSTDAHYAWRLSTGELPIYPEVVNECNPASHRLASPSPWGGRPGGTNACVNADVVIRFSTRLNPSQVSGASVVVRQCPSAEGDCATGTVVAPALGFPRLESADTDSSLIRFRPAANSERWSPATNYQVTLTTAIESERGVAMPEQRETCGEGNAYCFRFATRASTALCTVGAVLVNPAAYRFDDLEATTDVHANPLAADDACLQLNPDGYAWDWSVRDRAGRVDARVSVSTVSGVGGQSPDQTATARAEVDETDPALTTASLTVGRTPIAGSSEMSVALRSFVVDAYGPNCTQACINAAVWAEFSSPLQVASVTPENVEIRHCMDEACVTMEDPIALPTSALRVTALPDAGTDPTALGRFLLVRPTPLLRVGQTYRVLLRSGAHGGIVSTRGQALASLNNERGFTWIFQVKTENEGRCTVDHVSVAPEEKIESVIGARQRFTAMPVSAPDACSQTGEILVSESPYAWSLVTDTGAPDASVARLIERTDPSTSTTTDAMAPVRAGVSTSDQQLAEITGARDPREGETRLLTNIRALYQERTGRAVYGLLCGQRSESACPAGSGLTDGGCCAPRPRIVSRYPTLRGTGVCRNTEIFADFQTPLEGGSVSSSFILARNVRGVTVCPSGTRALDRVIAGTTDRWYTRVWDRVVALFRSSDASADVWCVDAVPGSIEVLPQETGSRVVYRIQNALQSDTDYRVYVRGVRDISTATATTTGIRSERGVIMEQESTEWTFHTGTGICQAQDIEINDSFAQSPYLFTSHPETHEWRGTVQSFTAAGVPAPITPVAEYAWSWGPWISADRTVLSTAAVSGAVMGDRANVLTNNKNGQSFISGRIDITRDAVMTPSTSGTTIETAKSGVVQLCERPWPGRSLGTFADVEGSASLRALAPMFAGGPFYHFSTGYCMDDGVVSSTEDDLPALRLNPVPLRAADLDQGILRQYLFTFTDPALRADGVGIRIAANPLHLSAARWYEAKGFRGTPQALTVDGYDAVRDGATIYISASDLNDTESVASSTIYILSRNPDARPATVNIFDQLVRNFVLNIGLRTETANVCVQRRMVGDPQVFLRAGVPVSCSADWECAAVRTSLTCASAKTKLQRDRARITDVQTMNISLENYRRNHAGKYPLLDNGSFISGLSSSRWPSWDQTLGSALGSTPPRDPVNRYTSCGRCRNTEGILGKICSENGECGGGETCVAMTGEDATRNGFDPDTCWNPESQRYLCPAIRDGGVTLQTSHIYQYRAVDAGSRYELSLNLEGVPATAYRPALVSEIRRCSNTNQLCFVETDCQVRDSAGVVRSTGTCQATGGTWLYGGICENTEYTASATCSATAVGPGQVCRLGETRAVSCTINGQAGTKIQTCGDCRAFVDSSQTVCTANVQCGNGRIDAGEACDDGARNGQYGFCSRTCQAAEGSCGDGVIASGEVCDNGSPTGTPLAGLPGVNGEYCGAGCDVANSCSLDCRAQAPHCGDATVDPSEQCDGNTERTAKALCVYRRTRCVVGPGGLSLCAPTLVADGACDTNADCGTGGTCGASTLPSAAACAPVTTRACSGGTSSGSPCTGDEMCGGGRCIALSYPTSHVRSCRGAGETNQCRFNDWSACQVSSSCGDGVLDASTGEECDDGISGNSGTGRCTPRCRLNVCGDGFVRGGSEDCDFGGRNGVRPSTIEYGSVGSMCTNECRVASVSGGFCGNGLLESGEACDGASIPPDATCRSLGFDYATTQAGGRDTLMCSSACTVTGCQSCSTRLGDGENVITGIVRDSILQNRGLRQARVSLRYNGATVSETYTDDTGRFRFGGLHNTNVCANYTIVISLQGWKINYSTPGREFTRTTDPADGYYPFSSRPFGFTTFRSRVGQPVGSDQVIFLTPRPAEGETIVVREWTSAITGRVQPAGQLIDPQLVLPMAMGYMSTTGGVVRCIVGSDDCQRTINWEGREGYLDLSRLPNAALTCSGSGGEGACHSGVSTAQTVLYRRSRPVAGGIYRYFLVDYDTGNETTDGNIDTAALRNVVRINWRDADGVERYQEISPSTDTTRSGDDCKKYWYVFDQDAVTGRLTIVNRFMCSPPPEATTYTSIRDDDGATHGINTVLTSRND